MKHSRVDLASPHYPLRPLSHAATFAPPTCYQSGAETQQIGTYELHA